MREITIDELFMKENPVIIDVRAPIEYKDGSIPGSINIPLFTDEERHIIGIIYKNEGQASAKWRAMELVSPKLPIFLKEIKEIAGGKNPVIHCWRGGMRSKAVMTFLEFSGIHARRLTGGYKAYRQHILKHIPEMLPEKAVVLHGMTGVGKTEILKILNSKGYPVLDLEAMAGHRGSIFGSIGLGDGHNQKTFDSLLFKRLQELQGSPYFIMEAESKRIGKISQSDELMLKKVNGIHIYVTTPMEERINLIAREYVEPYQEEKWYHEKIEEGMEKVFRRLKNEDLMFELKKSIENREYKKMIGFLLEGYYDPRYGHKRQEYEGDFFDMYADTTEQAAEIICSHLDSLSLAPFPNALKKVF